METIAPRQARRLALVRAGLLDARRSGLPTRAGRSPRKAALRVVDHFGYLQLDTVSVAGARSHALVLLSRLADLPPELPEELLQPGADVFEYWGHEASWIPLRLYPHFGFRRAAYRDHPWVQDILGPNRAQAEALLERIAAEGPLRSADLEGDSRGGWWDWKLSKKIATALWRTGDLAIRERTKFQRTYDLAERVIPARLREARMAPDDALAELLLLALAGHGWATDSTLRNTWRLRKAGPAVRRALSRLEEEGAIVRCRLELPDGGRSGWIRPGDLDDLDRLDRMRPRRDRPVLLSPFDPVLWDRDRVFRLFDFEQLLEIYKPKPTRRWGYYCLPVLAGDRLVSRVDLKADRRRRTLAVLSRHPEPVRGWTPAAVAEATDRAVDRHASALGLRVEDG